jgi:hypothetical protein
MIPLRTARRTGRPTPCVPWREGRVAITHPSLAAQIRQHIEAQYPYAACDECLTALLVATLDEIHAAALTVAKEEGFERRLRSCYNCQRTVELTGQV